jgi:hypothetical protein
MENKKKLTSTIAGVVFVGFMFIGLGIGFILGAILAGILLGMGAGFLAMGIVYALYRSKDIEENTKE